MEKNIRSIRYHFNPSETSENLKTEWTFFIINDHDFIPEIIENIRYRFEDSNIYKINNFKNLAQEKFNGNGLEYSLLTFNSDRNTLLSEQERNKIWFSPKRFKRDYEINLENLEDYKNWSEEYIKKLYSEEENQI